MMHVCEIQGTNQEKSNLMISMGLKQTSSVWGPDYFPTLLTAFDLNKLACGAVSGIINIIKTTISLSIPPGEYGKSRFVFDDVEYLVIVDSHGNIGVFKYFTIAGIVSLSHSYEGNFSGIKPMLRMLGVTTEHLSGNAYECLLQPAGEKAIKEHENGDSTLLNKILKDGYDLILTGDKPNNAFIQVTDYLKKGDMEYQALYDEIVSRSSELRNIINYGGIPVAKKEK